MSHSGKKKKVLPSRELLAKIAEHQTKAKEFRTKVAEAQSKTSARESDLGSQKLAYAQILRAQRESMPD